jgi:hypothetical protein
MRFQSYCFGGTSLAGPEACSKADLRFNNIRTDGAKKAGILHKIRQLVAAGDQRAVVTPGSALACKVKVQSQEIVRRSLLSFKPTRAHRLVKCQRNVGIDTGAEERGSGLQGGYAGARID